MISYSCILMWFHAQLAQKTLDGIYCICIITSKELQHKKLLTTPYVVPTLPGYFTTQVSTSVHCTYSVKNILFICLNIIKENIIKLSKYEVLTIIVQTRKCWRKKKNTNFQFMLFIKGMKIFRQIHLWQQVLLLK